MIEITIQDKEGKEVDRMHIDEILLGGRVRAALLKQALVMYHANLRQGNACTKSRGMVAGSTRKIYRQKGTGNARMGTVRSVIRRGGGVAFAKVSRDFSQRMPKKQRRLARNSAILNKLQNNNAVVIDELKFANPKTREFTAILRNLSIERSCVVAVPEFDENLYKSIRNIPRIQSLTVNQLNAWDICRHQKLLFTRSALESLLNPQPTESLESEEINDEVNTRG